MSRFVSRFRTVGDALDNALAETTIGLYKTECVRADSPFRTGPINTLADLKRDYFSLGALVQHEAPDAPPWKASSSRGRGGVL